MRTLQVVHERRVHCALCNAALFTIKDTRFGLAPEAVLCRTCTVSAFRADG